MIESARPLPLSASSTINKDDVLARIDEIQANMPDELRSARWLLKEREEFRAKMRREGDEIVALARNRAEQMVQRTQVVKAAEARARKVLETAETDSRRLRLEAEDYCDQKLGSFENVLQRTLQQVGAGRAKLQGTCWMNLANKPCHKLRIHLMTLTRHQRSRRWVTRSRHRFLPKHRGTSSWPRRRSLSTSHRSSVSREPNTILSCRSHRQRAWCSKPPKCGPRSCILT